MEEVGKGDHGKKNSRGDCEVGSEMGHNVLFWAVSGGVRVGVWLVVGRRRRSGVFVWVMWARWEGGSRRGSGGSGSEEGILYIYLSSVYIPQCFI